MPFQKFYSLQPNTATTLLATKHGHNLCMHCAHRICRECQSAMQRPRIPPASGLTCNGRIYWRECIDQGMVPTHSVPPAPAQPVSLFHCNGVEQIKMGAGCSCWRSIYRCVCDCVYLVALMPLAANLSISAGSEATVQPAAHVSAPFFAQKFQQQAQEQALLGCISCYQQMLRRKLNILLHTKIQRGANNAFYSLFFQFCASTAPSWHDLETNQHLQQQSR